MTFPSVPLFYLLHVTREPVQTTDLWQSCKSCYVAKAELPSLSFQCGFPTFSLFPPNGARVAGTPPGSVLLLTRKGTAGTEEARSKATANFSYHFGLS